MTPCVQTILSRPQSIRPGLRAISVKFCLLFFFFAGGVLLLAGFFFVRCRLGARKLHAQGNAIDLKTDSDLRTTTPGSISLNSQAF